MTDCNKNITLQERELLILREAMDEAEKKRAFPVVNSPRIKAMISIVEDFLQTHNVICYGGTAINNILPVEDQFYNTKYQIPDYDFFSKTPIDHAKKLADIYAAKGYDNVQAKAGIHLGTYKVFVDFIPIADITILSTELFTNLYKDAIKVNGILYTPPNFLRMGMYLELSRPAGDVSRWEKVLKRLQLLNKNYPINVDKCDAKLFQRVTDFDDKCKEEKMFKIARNSLAAQGCVFFGSYATFALSRHMPKYIQKRFSKIPDFDVLSEEPLKTATILKEQLEYNEFKKVKITKHDAIDDIIPEHYEVRVGNETIAFIYKTIACYSYNEYKLNNKYTIRIASIDTILSFYLAFLFANKDYHSKDRILCIADYLFTLQQKNKFSQDGLLKRFSTTCYGHQHTVQQIRSEKSSKFEELKANRHSKEFEKWFLNYEPTKEKTPVPSCKNKTRRNKVSSRKTKKTKLSTGFFKRLGF